MGLQAEIIFNLNIVSVLVEKSKIFGSDIVSMVIFWVYLDGKRKSVQNIGHHVQSYQEARILKLISIEETSGQPIRSIMFCPRPGATKIILHRVPHVLFSPVLIFDFQSLYPSIMIAYNICYSTCLGSINNIFDKEKHKRLGVS